LGFSRQLECSLRIHQDADIYASLLDKDESATHALGVGRRGWIQVVRGAIELNGKGLLAGDGAAVSNVTACTLRLGPTDPNFCCSTCHWRSFRPRNRKTSFYL